MKNEITKFADFIKQQWILVWLLVAISGLTTIVAYGVYTEGVYKMKRVVAPAAEIGGLFTSNHLIVGGGAKSVYYQEDAASPFSFPVEIRNYNPNDPNTKYHGTIEYSLTASLAHMNGNVYENDNPTLITNESDWNTKEMSITVSLGSESIVLSGSTLSDNLGTETKYSLTEQHDKDTWTVTFTNIPLGTDYCVKITAVPVNQDLSNISQVLAVNAVPEVYTEGWSCSIADDTENKTVAQYDAFNYTITGTGRKTLKFSYDSTKFEINPTFCNYITEAVSGSYSGSSNTSLVNRTNWKTITITADPDTTLVNRYDFQIYKVSSFQPDNYNEIKPSSPITSVKEGESVPTVYIEFEQTNPTP